MIHFHKLIIQLLSVTAQEFTLHNYVNAYDPLTLIKLIKFYATMGTLQPFLKPYYTIM